ncbi:phosphate-starvation-inducible protein PsiE [Oceanisphaera sp. IT1-181]|uniref:phosphate-starvation-inducible protein PsiE n=1 Tax=Oceanisphaera sp. IT1-181 TaxID=3081199 RepID=UPI0029CA155F|nr:phosphate-starvation-inducible protein PsiE [Oceanisphaera sp. IT1-181]
MKQSQANRWRSNIHQHAESTGNLLVEIFHYLALFAIGGMTAWAGTLAALDMLAKGSASIDDILLLFIYLELGAMVGIYFKTNHMPVRFLIYVAITALTRMMISDISHHDAPDMGVVYISGAILLLAIAVLVVRYASARFPGVKPAIPSQQVSAESHEGTER